MPSTTDLYIVDFCVDLHCRLALKVQSGSAWPLQSTDSPAKALNLKEVNKETSNHGDLLRMEVSTL